MFHSETWPNFDKKEEKNTMYNVVLVFVVLFLETDEVRAQHIL